MVKNNSSFKRKPKNKMGVKHHKGKNGVQKPKQKKEINYKEMDVSDFMKNEIDRSSDEESHIEYDDNDISKSLDITNQKEKNDDSDSEADSEQGDENEFESHKESLAKLKDIDPDFYKFLEENDKKLLQFHDSDDEDDDNEVDQLHKPSDDLEVASDESDFEPDDENAKIDHRVITLKLLKQWQSDIQTDKSAKTLNCLVKAFHAALLRVSTDEEVHSEYKVDGSSVFNAVVQLCVLELGPAIRRYIKLPPGSKQPPHKTKRFSKIRAMLRGYFIDLLKLLGGVTSTNILNVLLKHLHYMSPFVVSFQSVTKKLLKKVIHLWGTSEETIRVIAFMCILRITNNNQASYLDLVLKSMYMTYVRNCKFMSKSTLAEINFMRRSLTEMYTLDINVAYQHVFLYIRQLAIHLRSAVTIHKKENIHAVYNWQYINSIHLWSNLLTITCNKPQLQPLIYPLVQIALGVVKLLPTAQYYPLRFHVLQILIDLSRDTNIFIPILPFILEVLTSFDFNKKHKKVSMKPIDFTCILRVSKSQMAENGFKDALIDSCYGLLMEYLTIQANSISFPDLSLFAILQIKQFLKKCTVSNYTRRFKQIHDKIEQNSKFIETERKKINFNITDFKQIDAWETKIKNKGTPLQTFYDSWKKVHTINKRKQQTKNDELGEYDLPVLKKSKKIREKQDGPVELFPSDSEDDDDEFIKIKEEDEAEEVSKPIKKKIKTHRKNQSKSDTKLNHDLSGDKDIVKDINMSDW